MLRFIFLVAVSLSPLVFVSNVYAASEPLSFTSDITYSHNFKKEYDKYPEAIDKALEHFAFDKLVGNGEFLTVNALDQMNRIYIPRQYGELNEQRLIMAKSGFEVTGAIKYGEIYDASPGYIVHFKTKKSGDVALFFRGFSLERVQKIKKEITGLLNLNSQAENEVNPKSKSSLAARMNSLQSLFFPMAHAEEATEKSGSLCDSGFGPSPVKNVDAPALQKIWSCAKDIGGGVWDSTGGVVATVAKGAVHAGVFVIEGTRQIITDPAGTFNRAADELSKITDLFSDIDNSFGDLKSAFRALPQDVKLKIKCEIGGALGTAGLIFFLTSASGSPLLFRAIANALQKVIMALPAGAVVAAKLVKLASSMEEKADTAQANLDLMKKIKDVKGLAKENEDEMGLLKPQIIAGRDPLVIENGSDGYGTIQNLSSMIKELEMEPEQHLASWFEEKNVIARKKKIQELKAELAQQITKYEAAKKNYSRLKQLNREANSFLKSVKDNKTITLSQKAAIASYFSVSACTTRASVSETMKKNTSQGHEGAH